MLGEIICSNQVKPYVFRTLTAEGNFFISGYLSKPSVLSSSYTCSPTVFSCTSAQVISTVLLLVLSLRSADREATTGNASALRRLACARIRFRFRFSSSFIFS